MKCVNICLALLLQILFLLPAQAQKRPSARQLIQQATMLERQSGYAEAITLLNRASRQALKDRDENLHFYCLFLRGRWHLVNSQLEAGQAVLDTLRQAEKTAASAYVAKTHADRLAGQLALVKGNPGQGILFLNAVIQETRHGDPAVSLVRLSSMRMLAQALQTQPTPGSAMPWELSRQAFLESVATGDSLEILTSAWAYCQTFNRNAPASLLQDMEPWALLLESRLPFSQRLLLAEHLGRLYAFTQAVEKQEALFERLRRSAEKEAPAERNFQLASLLTLQAELRMGLNNPNLAPQAKNWGKQALNLLQSMSTSDTATLLRTHRLLGYAFVVLARLDSADWHNGELARLAAAWKTHDFGKWYHLKIAADFFYSNKNNYAAVPLYEKSLAILTRYDAHPSEQLFMLLNLADIHRLNSQPEMALQLLEKGEQLALKTPNSSPVLFGIYGIKGIILSAAANPEKLAIAKAAFAKAGEVLDAMPAYSNTTFFHVRLIENLTTARLTEDAAHRLEKFKNLTYNWENFRFNPAYLAKESSLQAGVLLAKNDTLAAIAELKKSLEWADKAVPYQFESFPTWQTLAILQAMTGNAREGLATLEQALALAEKKYPAHLPLKRDIFIAKANLLKISGQHDGYFQAMEQLERLQLSPANCDSAFLRISYHASSLGYHQQAVAYADSALACLRANQSAPERIAIALLRKATCQLDMSKDQSSLDLLESNLHYCIEHRLPDYLLGQAVSTYTTYVFASGDVEAGFAKLEEFEKKKGEPSPESVSIFALNKATMLTGQGKLDAARAQFKIAADLADSNPQLPSQTGFIAHNLIAYTYLMEGNQAQAILAARQARRFINLEAFDFTAMNFGEEFNNTISLAENFLSAGALEEARQLNQRCLDKAAKVSNGELLLARTWLQRGNISLKEGKFDEVLQAAQQGLALLERFPGLEQKTRAGFYFLLSQAHKGKGDHQQAQLFEEKMKQENMVASNWLGANRLLNETLFVIPNSGDNENTYRTHKQTWEILKNQPGYSIQKAMVAWNLASVCSTTGRLDEAEELCRFILSNDLTDWQGQARAISVQLILGYVAEARGRKDDAQAFREQAKAGFTKLEPTSPHYPMLFEMFQWLKFMDASLEGKKRLLAERELEIQAGSYSEARKLAARVTLANHYLVLAKSVYSHSGEFEEEKLFLEKSICINLGVPQGQDLSANIQAWVAEKNPVSEDVLLDALNYYTSRLRNLHLIKTTAEFLLSPTEDVSYLNMQFELTELERKNNLTEKEEKQKQKLKASLAEEDLKAETYRREVQQKRKARLDRMLNIQLAINQLMERQSGKVRTEQERLTFNETRQRYLHAAADGLLDAADDLGENSYADQAFRLLESRKGSVLAGMMRRAELKKNLGGAAAQESQLRDSLHQVELRLKTSPNDALLRQKLDLQRQLTIAERQISIENPEYHKLMFTSASPGIADLQKLLDDKTLVLSFHLDVINQLPTEKPANLPPGAPPYPTMLPTSINIELFAIRKDTFKHITLFPGVLFLSSLNLLQNPLAKDTAYENAAWKIYETLFPDWKLSKKWMQGIENLIVIPDGELANVSFEALLTDSVEHKFDYAKYPFLLKKYNVSYAYSAFLLQENLRRPKPLPTAPSLLALAPVQFGGNAQAVPYTEELVNELTRLPATKVTSLKFAEANKKNLFSALDGGNFRYLLLSSHGIIEDEQPELSHIALAGDGKDADRHLYVADLYTRKIKADMVALSGCQTNRGRLLRGEGIVGFTHALMYAGCRNVLVSQRLVGRGSKVLMEAFFKELDKSGGNISYSQALRNAKLAMLADPHFANPHWWSAFILVGQ